MVGNPYRSAAQRGPHIWVSGSPSRLVPTMPPRRQPQLVFRGRLGSRVQRQGVTAVVKMSVRLAVLPELVAAKNGRNAFPLATRPW